MKTSTLVGLAITAMFLAMFYLTNFQGAGWAVFGLLAAFITLLSAF